MSKPDRFTKQVERVRWSDPDIPIMMLKLLRAQHRACMRLVKRRIAMYEDFKEEPAMANYKKGLIDGLDNVLTDLDEYRKAKP